METIHWCGRELHDGEPVPATWMIRQAVGFNADAAEQSLSAALVPSAGDGSVYCACDDHLVQALNGFGTDKFIVRRVSS